MKFQVGDKVVIQHSSDEGEVVEILNDKMVLVDVRGVRFPAYTDQLDFPYFKRFSEKKIPPPDKKPKKYVDQLPPEKLQPNQKKERIAKLADGVWLTFLPVFDNDEFGDDVVESLKVHLVNNTQAGYHFSYHLNYFGSSEFDLDNQIHPFQDFYIHDIPFANLNDNPVFECEFSLLTPDKGKADHYETSLKPRAKQVFSRIEEIKKKGEATFSFPLFETYPNKEVEESVVDTGILSGSGFRIYEASRARQHLEPARSELDLHIEKLTEKWSSLDNFEILTLQLQTFEKYFDLALAHHLPSMIVIHGVGSGKLRDEIHELLRAKRRVKSFVNRYHPRYGYGATEIFFQY
ncbi:Smr/MutS family protein [Flavitalea sp. BT771]|uniref:Smr/MutS family protein n=1 Tax=Flavitalea sp. BT771 TaxID=3063329 RepID=UPI0026E340BA|nr:Smr/MutS family protein [Flavitalea sp. BT771]MDO6434663.1 Smr/MutS family protein [Flavitalea sp. BT771]MDV6223563.1 Smr/MutS family protein [Flavitalea sp. BT771]